MSEEKWIGRGFSFISVGNSLPHQKPSIGCAVTFVYDPGIKMEGVSTTHPQIKRRSQFRIKSSQIPLLYRAVDEVDLGLGRAVDFQQ